MGVAVWVWVAAVPAAPVPPPQEQPPPAAVAAEFLRLALAGKTEDALKLTVPGTVSENKAGEIRRAGYTGTKVVAVLANDTRTEVVFAEIREEKGRRQHLVLMLAKGKDGAWQVKDVDARDEAGVAERVKLYLAGRYDEKPGKD
jgi:hypothetical protein